MNDLSLHDYSLFDLVQGLLTLSGCRGVYIDPERPSFVPTNTWSTGTGQGSPWVSRRNDGWYWTDREKEGWFSGS